MGALNEYLQQCQRFIRDQNMRLINPQDMIDYCNRARRKIASDAQCIRVLAPISGAVITATIVSGGTGYSSSPTLTISAPDSPSGDGAYPGGSQATAEATVVAGVITDIQIDYGGAGYFQPALTITDTTGTGASAILAVSPISTTQANREVYKFSDVPLDNFPGVGSILAVKSVSFIYANLRYSIPIYPFTAYQAKIRNYPYQYYYVPTMGAQFGQGVNGSIYAYPISSQMYQMEFDSICLPIDLDTDEAFEAIPLPWTDAVPYLAAHFCFLELQNLNAARFYLSLFTEMMQGFSAAARPGRATNPNGDGRW